MVWKWAGATRNWAQRWRRELLLTGGSLLNGLIPMAVMFVIGAAVMAALVGPVGPEWVTFKYWQKGGQDTSRSEVLRNVGLLFVAMIGLAFGIWRAYTAHRQANVAEQGHFTERFSTAVEHLGSEELSIRLGGIYALWRLAEDSPRRDEKPIWDILCSFVRDPPHTSALNEAAPADAIEAAMAAVEDKKEVRPDVQAILDLIKTDAAAARRENADYRMNLSGADFRGADLNQANLTKADLKEADLSSVFLMGANLTNANLFRANLTDAILMDANLTDASLYVANLTHANFNDANLTNTDLTHANLTDANLMGANLTNASLHDANLTRAILDRTNLTDAKLFRANLIEASVEQSQLDTALYHSGVSPPVNLPEGLVWREPPRTEK